MKPSVPTPPAALRTTPGVREEIQGYTPDATAETVTESPVDVDAEEGEGEAAIAKPAASPPAKPIAKRLAEQGYPKSKPK